MDYVLENNIVKIECSKIDEVHIYFDCPFCHLHHKKNGDPRKRSKRVIHEHGNTGNLENGSRGTRIPHCISVGEKYAKKLLDLESYSFELLVTDKTKRIEKSKLNK